MHNFFAQDTLAVAMGLLGKVVRVGECSGMIVETEAYTTDEASHGRVLTERSRLMHETFGHVYVYLIYGMYHCLNFTSDAHGVGAVLIRSLEPLEGIDLMKERRRKASLRDLTSGPGKLTQALDITMKEHGGGVGEGIVLEEGDTVPEQDIIATTRIGIKKDAGLPWRFYVRGNEFVSRKG